MTAQDFQRRSPLGIAFHYLRPHRGLFVLDLACALVIALIDLAFPAVSRWSMNTLLPVRAYGPFFAVCAGAFAAFLLRSCMTYVVGYWGHTFGILVEADIRRDLFAHIQELSLDWSDGERTGQLLSRLTNDLFDITELAHHGPEDLFISGVTITGSLVLLYGIQWRLALLLTAVLPVFLAVVWRCRRSMRLASAAVKESTAAIDAQIEAALSGIRTTKAFANEQAELAKFDLYNARFRTSKRQFHKAMGRFNAAMELFLCLLSALVVAAGGWLIMRGEMDLVDLITFNLYVAAFVGPIRKLSNFAELFANGAAGLRRFALLMRQEPSMKDAEDAETLDRVEGRIDLDGVRFAYRDGPEVLHGIDLHIRPGETAAVVGPSGGGKTTLCSLFPRFYDVTAGSVRIDGRDVRAVTQASLRRNVGIVQQEVFLFADSILENIRYGRPGASEEDVVRAARLAEIWDDIAAMPDGLHTWVGERGVRLSGGQRQRIAIARTFLKDPPVLILDEATSSLDSVTEARLQSAFQRLSRGRTTILIAHRLSTIRDADRIFVVDGGRIAEEGPHAALMDRDGVYAALVRAQEVPHG